MSFIVKIQVCIRLAQIIVAKSTPSKFYRPKAPSSLRNGLFPHKLRQYYYMLGIIRLRLNGFVAVRINLASP